MAENSREPVQFGRVVYIEPNNDINGTGKGTNFTFNPEDYSILVDLQVDVVDRFAINGSGTKDMIQYTLEWDAKGTKTSMFKGTNGMLTTRALNTSFSEIISNYNQEAIGINSIDIRYNSWNYPEITIQFTDIRGASLLSAADYVHTVLVDDDNKGAFTDNFANTLFSTFFRFPYPRYTLIVKGFYGRPVSYSLCVNDFKTKFNASTGNFDVTVSFIGYMYGLLTDIPMRLLLAAPYDEYVGSKHWDNKITTGDFVYAKEKKNGNEGTNDTEPLVPMMKFIKFYEKVRCIRENLEKFPELAELADKVTDLKKKKTAVDDIKFAYQAFQDQFNGKTKKKYKIDHIAFGSSNAETGEETEGRSYVVIYSGVFSQTECEGWSGEGRHVVAKSKSYGGGSITGGGFATIVYEDCEKCGGDGLIPVPLDAVVDIESDMTLKEQLYGKISEFNAEPGNSSGTIEYISRISSPEDVNTPIKGNIAYHTPGPEKEEDPRKVLTFVENLPDSSMTYYGVDPGDLQKLKEYLSQTGVTFANTIRTEEQFTRVGVAILNVTAFEKSLNAILANVDQEIEDAQKELKDKQNEVYEKILGFKVTLKNVIDMCLAHLDTFIASMYACMDKIREKNRLFEESRLHPNETDVQSTTPNNVYLPPFFSFKVKNKETDDYEDEWLENDAQKRFTDRDKFQEIQLVDGYLNGMLKAQKDAREEAEREIGEKAEQEYGEVVGKDYYSTFANDYLMRRNPYKNVYDGTIESLVAMFAFRCMLGTVYVTDYPNIGNRFDEKDDPKIKFFENLGKGDAENFKLVKEDFEAFRNTRFDKRKTSANGVANTFENLTWDDFEKYITGKTGLAMQTEKGHMYFSGVKNPLFEKSGSYYILAYGNDDNSCVVPMNYTSPYEAVEYSKAIIDRPPGGIPADNGFGISRLKAMPSVEIIGDDKQLVTDFPGVKTAFFELTSPENLRDFGWYEKDVVNWSKFYSGVASRTFWEFWKPGQSEYTKEWFPTVVSINAIENAKNDVPGVLYSTSGQDVALSPIDGGLLNIKEFFVDKGGVRLNEKSAQDKTVEKIVESMIADVGEITLIGLGCGEGTLFESDFYLKQTNIYAKAFLFLHSLPTAEYGCLGEVVSTIIKRTYMPSIADIPLASALFIGALYARFDGLFSEVTTGYKRASIDQLITHGNFSNIRRPLNPIKDTERNASYITIITNETEEEITALEKKSANTGTDSRLRKYLEGKDTQETLFCGFWKVDKNVKDQFIKLFKDWAEGEFTKLIEPELSLRTASGAQVTPDQVKALKTILTDVYKSTKDRVSEARKDFNEAGYVIRKNKGFNEFIRENFKDTFWKNHIKFGASSKDNSLFTMIRRDTQVSIAINNLLSNGCTVKVAFPRALMTRDVFSPSWPEERKKLRIDGKVLEAGWEAFKNGIISGLNEGDMAEENRESEVGNVTEASVNPEAKLSLYETFKNIHDKWLIATSPKKYEFSNRPSEVARMKSEGRPFFSSFYYINSFHEEVGQEINLNIEELPNQIKSVIESFDEACSLYSFMYDIAQQARVQLLALPVFNDMANPAYVRQMFSPMPFDEINVKEIDTETSYVFMYPEEPSKQLSLPCDSNMEEERYKFVDDSFMMVTESGTVNTDGKTPSTFLTTKGRNVPVIGVTFAKQNQSFFKNISVSMDSPKTTEVAIQNTFMIADKYSGGNTQVTALGQDLFSIYSNYSYECTVEMMGCACIMPLMYFQLNNIPMFKGTYIIYNVAHSITPGNMSTTFSGQRLSRYRKRRNENAFAVAPNDNGDTRDSSYHGRRGDVNDSTCTTPSGERLLNEATYDMMVKTSGVNDKAALRAVEFAETHYTGGLFGDGKLKVYYDPYKRGMTSQFSTDYTLPKTYDENVAVIGTDSGATLVGAFGMPGDRWQLCGAASMEEFFTKSANGFGDQGAYFATYLKNKTDAKNALANKNWLQFAQIYKADTYCPGGFEAYAKDLEAGYNDADSAKKDNTPNYATSGPRTDPPQGRYDDMNPHEQESTAYANSHPFKNVTAANWLKNNNTVCYVSGSSKKIDRNNVINGHTVHPGNGKKKDTESISRCATYVKLAIQEGGIPYPESCNGGACGPVLERTGWEEIYRSGPGEPSAGDVFDSHWEIGDVMTIENFGTHKVGHIMMWCGDKWRSDFAQNTCRTYGDWLTAWNQGLYHVWRYRNKTNT